MTGDISSVPPLSAAMVLARAGASPAELLKLLQPQEGLLAPGEAADAQVLTLKQTDQAFQLLLKLTMDSGRQVNLPVTSPLPLAPGTTVTVTQPSAGALTINMAQIAAALATSLTSIDTSKLPVGTLLQGKGLTSQIVAQAVNQLTSQQSGAQPGAQTAAQPGAQPVNQAVLYRSIVLLLNTAQAGTSLTIESPRPLTVGSLLSAQVQGSQSLNFVPLPGRLDQLAVAQQLATQQSRQGSLSTLITALQNLQNNGNLATANMTSANPATGATVSLPPALQASIDQLLADLPDIEQMTTPKAVAQAFSASGLFMEARLLAGTNPAALPDLKANVLRVIAQLLPGLPDSSYDDVAMANTLARAMPGLIRSALGTLGLVAPRPQASSFPLPSRSLISEGKDDLEILLKLAAAAVSRLQSHQLGGLEQTRTAADGTQLTTWQLEIPMRNAHDVVPLQVKVQREDKPENDKDHERDENEVKEVKDKIWRIELAFDLEPLGPLQVQAQLIQGSLSSQLWAERQRSAELIGQELGTLRKRLVTAGLMVGELACRQGTPPQGPRTHLEQRWIDETA